MNTIVAHIDVIAATAFGVICVVKRWHAGALAIFFPLALIFSLTTFSSAEMKVNAFVFYGGLALLFAALGLANALTRRRSIAYGCFLIILAGLFGLSLWPNLVG